MVDKADLVVISILLRCQAKLFAMATLPIMKPDTRRYVDKYARARLAARGV